MFLYQSRCGGGAWPAAESAAAVGWADDGNYHLNEADDGEDGVSCDAAGLFEKVRTTYINLSMKCL